MKKKPEDFYESEKIFSKWREKHTDMAKCMYQCYGNNILIEKWILITDKAKDVVLVEIYPDGNGFTLYELN